MIHTVDTKYSTCQPSLVKTSQALDSREACVVFLLDLELVPAAEPVVLVALGQRAPVRQDEVRALQGGNSMAFLRFLLHLLRDILNASIILEID